jgi:hypothetical protein
MATVTLYTVQIRTGPGDLEWEDAQGVDTVVKQGVAHKAARDLRNYQRSLPLGVVPQGVRVLRTLISVDLLLGQ